MRAPQVWHQAVQYLDPLPCHGQGQVLRLEATHNATRIRFRVLSLSPETSEADVKGLSKEHAAARAALATVQRRVKAGKYKRKGSFALGNGSRNGNESKTVPLRVG